MTIGPTSADEGKGVPEEGGVPYEQPQGVKDSAKAVSKEGFVDEGGGGEPCAVRALVPEAKSTHERIRKLMEEGVPEEEAKERAVAEAVGEIEGKEKDYPDMAAYVRDQREKMDEYKIILDGSVPGTVSRWFAKPGDYLRCSIQLFSEICIGVAYLSGDNTIRFLCYPSESCMIGGERAGGRLPSADLALLEFHELSGDTLAVRDWLQERLEKYAAKKEVARGRRRGQDFEF